MQSDAKRRDEILKYVQSEFERADLNHDGAIDEDEFTLYYFRDLCFKFPVGKNGFNPGAALYNIFCNYCSFGKGGKRCEEMESHQFSKLAIECRLVDKVLCRKADIDLVFHRARAENMQKKARPFLGDCMYGRTGNYRILLILNHHIFNVYRAIDRSHEINKHHS